MHGNTDITLVPIHIAQAPELSIMCRELHMESFAYLWEDDGEWYLNEVYGMDRIQAELQDPGTNLFFIEREGSRIGYLKLNPYSDLDDEPAGLEIERIYLYRKFAGKGLGTRVMNAALAIAERYARNYVWLHVMDSSIASIKFYLRRGFSIVGETRLPFEPMKPSYRRMWRMKRALESSSSLSGMPGTEA